MTNTFTRAARAIRKLCLPPGVRKGVCIAALLGIDCGLAAESASAPQLQIETQPTQRIEAIQTFETKYPDFHARQWIAFAAAAPELPSQSEVSTELAPNGKEDRESSRLQRPVVYTKERAISAEQKTRFQYVVTYRAQLHRRKLVPVTEGAKTPVVAPLDASKRRLYLAPTTFYDFKDAGFKNWLKKNDLKIKSNESQVDFARRVFETIFNNFSYEALQASDHRASAVCQSGRSHCGGLSALFVAAMRANNIPARSLIGNWAQSSTPGGTIGDYPARQQHVMAEFYVEDVGWVPVDPSKAICHFKDKPGEMLEQSFGLDCGDFLTKQVDHDFELDAGVLGKLTVPWPHGAFPVGKGTANGAMTDYDWKVRVLDTSE